MGLFKTHKPLFRFGFLKAQGVMPWAFLGSIGIHAILVAIAWCVTMQVTRHKPDYLNGLSPIRVSIAQRRNNESSESLDISKKMDLLQVKPSFGAASKTLREVAVPDAESFNGIEAENSSLVSRETKHSLGEQTTSPIRSIAMPNAVAGIWHYQISSRANDMRRAEETAQWQARKMEAIRQFSLLERTFPSAPKPELLVQCVITHMKRDCSSGGEVFGDFWASRFAFLYGIDPSFSPIEMRYEPTSGWYAVIRTISSDTHFTAP